jgi:intein/homing endonuclease
MIELRNNQITFRDYQFDIIRKGTEIVTKYGFVYLAMEVRTGKTLTSLGIAERINSSNVLFLTKKKAIGSIRGDYNLFNPPYHLTVTNYESLHKIENTDWDLIVLDEAHSCFLENTLIDGVKIKDIELGSLQKSFNFAKGIYEYRKVLNVFKNPLTENLIKIKCNGKEIVCTESHKIFTKRGWVKAGELLPTDELQVL